MLRAAYLACALALLHPAAQEERERVEPDAPPPAQEKRAEICDHARSDIDGDRGPGTEHDHNRKREGGRDRHLLDIGSARNPDRQELAEHHERREQPELGVVERVTRRSKFRIAGGVQHDIAKRLRRAPQQESTETRRLAGVSNEERRVGVRRPTLRVYDSLEQHRRLRTSGGRADQESRERQTNAQTTARLAPFRHVSLQRTSESFAVRHRAPFIGNEGGELARLVLAVRGVDLALPG